MHEPQSVQSAKFSLRQGQKLLEKKNTLLVAPPKPDSDKKKSRKSLFVALKIIIQYIEETRKGSGVRGKALLIHFSAFSPPINHERILKNGLQGLTLSAGYFNAMLVSVKTKF